MNISERLKVRAQQTPQKKAIICPKGKNGDGSYNYESWTFSELQDRADALSYFFHSKGLRKGQKVLVFVPPCLDFPAITFSLFRLGVAPIFIDPGMGRKNLMRAVAQIKPDGMIAIPKVHFIKKFFRKTFSSIKYSFTTGKGNNRDIYSLDQKLPPPPKDFDPEPVVDTDLAAILFTSGGTGIPKGVVYTHKIFAAQTDILGEMFKLGPTDVDIPGFPLFSLFTIALGITSCPPDMDPSNPSKANPENLIQNITDHQGTFVAGSPAIWVNVADYCLEKGITLPTVTRVVMFGAPVSLELHRKFEKILPNGTTYTPYGATECLPVSNFSGKDILGKTEKHTEAGKGTCIGVPAPGVTIKIIPITDDVVRTIDQTQFLSPGEIGEILVTGDMVTPRYWGMPDKTELAKVYETTPEGERVWHRMGDVGHFDEDGKLWFCGRKTHRVETEEENYFSTPCEAIFNQHPDINRTALIQIKKGNQWGPGLVVEKKGTGASKGKIVKDLLELGSKHSHTKNIKHIYFKKEFPVDVRHNIKIDRIKLRNVAKGPWPWRNFR